MNKILGSKLFLSLLLLSALSTLATCHLAAGCNDPDHVSSGQYDGIRGGDRDRYRDRDGDGDSDSYGGSSYSGSGRRYRDGRI